MISIIMAGFAPSVALLSFLYLKKQIDQGPITMIIRMFLFGVLLVFPTMVLQETLNEGFNLSEVGQSIFTAAFLEEFLKWFVIFFIAIPHAEIKNRYDGIMYSTAVGLGFATLENIIYLWIYGVEQALMRALLPVSSHALFGVIMGYYVSKAMLIESNLKRRWLIYSLIIPIGLHAIFNYLLILGSSDYWLWVMVPFMLVLWWYGLNKISLVSKDDLKNVVDPSKNKLDW